MDNLLILFLVILLIYQLAKFFFSYITLKQTLAQAREEISEKIRVVQLEKLPTHANLILAFDAENNNFLGQGFSEEEIKERIMSRYPRHIFIMNERIFSALKDLNLPHEDSNQTSNAR